MSGLKLSLKVATYSLDSAIEDHFRLSLHLAALPTSLLSIAQHPLDIVGNTVNSSAIPKQYNNNNNNNNN